MFTYTNLLNWELLTFIKDARPPIKATWYSGVLRIPTGKRLSDGLIGRDFLYEQDIYLTVKNGEVLAETLVDNRREGATRSSVDYLWTALAEEPVKDDGKWHDARLIRTAAFDEIRENEREFVTRGIVSWGRTRKARWLSGPTTPTTNMEIFALSSPAKKLTAKHRGHIEIKARPRNRGNKLVLEVMSLRELKPGETIHHPDFKPPQIEPQGEAP